jgi:peptidoglycan hydrolase-like protein with peptidoglycan-binding domain
LYDIEESPRDRVRDLADPTHAGRSLRASLDRRVRLARRRRATSGGRRAVVAATCLLALGAGGAMAQDRVGGNGSGQNGAQTRAGGYAVKAVQRKLGVQADGVAGPQTKRAVKRFQKRNGLTADGVVGPATLEALGLPVQAAAGDPAAPTAADSSAANGDAASRLERIAQCESGGDPKAVSPDGSYRGKYQFARATWKSLGGEGDPIEASEDEQDLRAAALLEKQGPSAWPVCSKR